jgi:AraC-like DNA-binding protein
MAMGNEAEVKTPADAYGRKFGTKFGAEDAPFVATRSLQGDEIAVTELRVKRALGLLSDTIANKGGYHICLMLADIPENAYWENGRQVSNNSIRAGDVTIHDLAREPQAVIEKPIHSLIMHLPSSAFRTLAEQANVPAISSLRYVPGEPISDQVIRHIGLALVPALQNPEQANRLLIDHLLLAFAAHTAQLYGGMLSISRSLKGGLAPWQERRSKEMLAGDLTGSTPLQVIAETCGLSMIHFSRAFHKSTGLSPHAWLLQARVDSVMAMLRTGDTPLFIIAQACGFANQSHFTRAFTRRVGLSPGSWRKTTLG